MAEYLVRGEIVKQKEVLLLSFDEFCRREATRILAVYNLDPAELGISVAPPTAAESALPTNQE
jgi:hypothetical protein